MVLLRGRVDVVGMLACHRIVHRIESRLYPRYRDDWLHPVSQLLVIQSHVWSHWWSSE
jgi:hypothetical protein